MVVRPNMMSKLTQRVPRSRGVFVLSLLGLAIAFSLPWFVIHDVLYGRWADDYFVFYDYTATAARNVFDLYRLNYTNLDQLYTLLTVVPYKLGLMARVSSVLPFPSVDAFGTYRVFSLYM